MIYDDSSYVKEVNGKWIYTGTFFHEGKHGQSIPPKLRRVQLHRREREYLVHIALTMLSAPGGDFNEDDTVYADIYRIDGQRMSSGSKTGKTGHVSPDHNSGGVWEHHFGNRGDDTNEGISSYVGQIDQEVVLRIFIQGDDCLGASYFIMEL